MADSREHGFYNLIGQPPQRHSDRCQDYVVCSRLDEIDQRVAGGRWIQYGWKVLRASRRRRRRLAGAHQDLNRSPDLQRVTANHSTVIVEDSALAAEPIDVAACRAIPDVRMLGDYAKGKLFDISPNRLTPR